MLLSLVLLGVLSGIETCYIVLLSVVLQRVLLPLYNTYIGKCIPYSNCAFKYENIFRIKGSMRNI